MPTIQFWEDWSIEDRRLFWLLVIPAILIVTAFWIIYFQDSSLAFLWDQYQRLEVAEISIRTFQVGLLNINIPGDNHLLFETFAGSALQPLPFAYQGLLISLVIGLNIVATFISTLKRISFLIGGGLLIIAISSLQIETLLPFGLTTKLTSALFIILFVGLAFFFQTIRQETPFGKRLIAFLLLSSILGVMLSIGSETPQPFLHLAANGLIVAIVTTIVFMLMISHEVIAFFIPVVTSGIHPKKSAFHFFLVSGIYFFYLLLTYLVKERILSWDLFTVNLFFLFTLSSIFGLWGVNKRYPLFSNKVSTASSAVFLYVGCLIISYGSLLFFFVTSSDTIIDALDDLVLFSHLGYGLIFILYVISNFSPMLVANLPVYRVLYKPATMPFFTFRLMSLIATFAFLSYASPWSTYTNKVYAALYTAQADLYFAEGDLLLAEGYYKKSLSFREQNHHANYCLAKLYQYHAKEKKEQQQYSRILESSPSEMAFVNLSDTYARYGNNLRASVTLGEGLKKFPASGRLQIAQGVSFAKLGLVDSAFFYFQQARNSTKTKELAETNLLATIAQYDPKFPADSLYKLLNMQEEGAKINALALANAQQLKLNLSFNKLKDTTLSVKQATLLCNQIINQRITLDTSSLSYVLTLARKPTNDYFKESLLYSISQSYYEKGFINKGIELAQELAYSFGKPKYYMLLGVWHLEQENPLKAIQYFTVAGKDIFVAQLYEALSRTEAGDSKKASEMWSDLAVYKDSTISKLATRYQKILTCSPADVIYLNDIEKHDFCKYRIALNDSLLFQNVLSAIGDETIKARTLFERSKKYFINDEIDISISYLELLRDLKPTDQKLSNDILFLNLILATKKSNWDYLQKQMNLKLPEYYLNEEIYLQAMLNKHLNKTSLAFDHFTYLATANDQFEDGILASAQFFQSDTDRLKSHSILVNGLLAKPNSIKLLKEYVKVTAKLGFENELKDAIFSLKQLMTESAFKRFITANQELLSILESE